jgi:hypothetical protein
MSNSPVKFIGAAARALGMSGGGGIGRNLSGNLGAIAGLFGGRQRGGAKGRIKGLENRVSALENMGSQTNAAGASMAAANADVSQPGTATVDGLVGGYGNFNPATMQMNNNALGDNPITPMQGLQNMQNKIAAPGPLSTQEEGFMSDDLLNSL